MASAHTRKRPYQSNKITAFFTPSSSAPGSTTSPTPTVRPPPPPSHVQSSLLNVGMRVRKSVHDGYKTKSPSSSQPTTPALSQGAPAPARGYFPSSQDAYAPPSSAPPALQTLPSVHDRELQPFCGLHSTGSWSSQQSQPAVASGHAMTWSNTTTETDGRKRRHDEEEDDYDEEMEREMDEVFSQEERRIAPLKGRAAGITAQRMPGTLGDFDDGDVRFLVTDMEE